LLTDLEQANRRLQDHAAQVEELAALQERSLMARELHDSVTQTLFSMNLTVQAARMLVEKEPAHVAGQLDRLQELAGNAAAEIRTLARQLRPLPLAGETLVAGLVRLANERQRRDGLQVNLEVQGEKDLPEPVIAGLYRIVQEALNNVSRHAGACEAQVRLDLVSRPAYLEIEDRGAGFEPGKLSRSANHLGLSGMAERACEIGWTLKIHSQPGRGTRIRVEEVENVEAGRTAPHPA
jgi:signal transduction histidine kinase